MPPNSTSAPVRSRVERNRKWRKEHGTLVMEVECRLLAGDRSGGVPEPGAAAGRAGLSPEQVQVLRSHGFEDQEAAGPADAEQAVVCGGHRPAWQPAGRLREPAGPGSQARRYPERAGGRAYRRYRSGAVQPATVGAPCTAGGGAAGACRHGPLQISTRGWGNSKPLPMAQGQDARRENRRVAIIIPAPVGP
jgi:hypothetical protein